MDITELLMAAEEMVKVKKESMAKKKVSGIKIPS